MASLTCVVMGRLVVYREPQPWIHVVLSSSNWPGIFTWCSRSSQGGQAPFHKDFMASACLSLTVVPLAKANTYSKLRVRVRENCARPSIQKGMDKPGPSLQ